jgi:hypothetical protein
MNKQDDKFWTDQETKLLLDNFDNKNYDELSDLIGRSLNAIKHKCWEYRLHKRGEPAKIGDVINGWKIVEIYTKNIGSQSVTCAKVVSTINDKTAVYRLTQLTQGKVGWPDRRRPDVSIKNLKHNKSHTRLYSIWNGMKNRCYNSNTVSYKNYGGRNIQVCNEWLNSFQIFYDWSISNGYDVNLTLDRIDNDGNYTPDNCRWASRKKQCNNKSDNFCITAWNEKKTAAEWIEDSRCKATYNSIIYRVKVGWLPEKAIETPNREIDYD